MLFKLNKFDSYFIIFIFITINRRFLLNKEKFKNDKKQKLFKVMVNYKLIF